MICFEKKGAFRSRGPAIFLAIVLLSSIAGCSETPPSPELSFWASGQAVTSIREDEAFVIRFTGAPPGARVTLRSRFRGYGGWGRYQADGQGVVDVGRDAALEGTYSGVDSDGLVWSMLTESKDPDGPLDVQVSAEVDGAPVVQATLLRAPLEAGLVRRDAQEDGLTGVFYGPAAGTPGPAVLVLGGSEGGLGLSSRRAAHLASQGFAALALAYFGAEGLPPTLANIPLEYFQRALAWLARQPEVQPDRIAVLGISRGSEAALQLGATFHGGLRAVVAEVPSHIRWNGFDRSAPGAAWTERGVPLPFLGFGTPASPDKPVQPPPPSRCPVASPASAWPGASSSPTARPPPR